MNWRRARETELRKKKKEKRTNRPLPSLLTLRTYDLGGYLDIYLPLLL